MKYTMKPINFALGGRVRVPSDKSIAHRLLILGAIAKGDTKIIGELEGEDVRATIRCLLRLGVKFSIDDTDTMVTVHGKGLYGLEPPFAELDCLNSATTMRLLAGVLSAQRFDSVLTGDASLMNRPMERIITPLTEMGAKIKSKNGHAPLYISGQRLQRKSYHIPMQSAQVKSCLQLANLYAMGDVDKEITGAERARNHTEVMINEMTKNGTLTGTEMKVPGDISSAMFFVVLALLHKGSYIEIEDVGINKTRIEALLVLQSAGANIEIQPKYIENGEPVGTICTTYSTLAPFKITSDQIPQLIDEIPILAVAAAFTNGQSVFEGLNELRHKETDRIKAIVQELSKLGIDISETEDTIIINGTNEKELLVEETMSLKSHGDHRIAMACTIAASKATIPVEIQDVHCIGVSYPSFFDELRDICVYSQYEEFERQMRRSMGFGYGLGNKPLKPPAGHENE